MMSPGNRCFPQSGRTAAALHVLVPASHSARLVMHPWVKAGKRTESGRKAPRPSVDVATYPRRQVGRGTWDAHDDDWERGLSDVLDLRMGGRSGNRRHR